MNDNIAIITARSGSKGLIDKNIKIMNGKPMMAYTIEEAVNSGVFSEVMVSTDSEQYASLAREYGAEVPFLRSELTSSDSASSWDVVAEVLLNYERIGKRFDSICILQPTSPLRTSKDIIGAYALFEDKDADAVAGVCECEHPKEYMMTLDEDASLKSFRESEVDLPRQMLPQYYRLNGAIFIRRIEYLHDGIALDYKNEYAFIMDKDHSVDIDSIDDFEYAEFLIKKREKSADV